MDLVVEYFNKNRKILFQVMGPFDNTFDPEEDDYEDEEEYNAEFIELVSSKLNIETIPECKFCKGKDKTRYIKKKKKFVWVKCPRCGGIGLEREGLEGYRVG